MQSIEQGLLSRRDVTVALVVTGTAAILVSVMALLLDDPPAERAARAFSFFALSVPPLLLAVPGWLRAARRVAGGRWGRWLFGLALLITLAPDRLARGSVFDLLGAAVYGAVALLLTADRPRRPEPLWRDVALVLTLWFPLEFGWVPGDLTMLRLLGLDLLFLLYMVERPVMEPGRLITTRRRELAWGVGCWLAFMPIAIPFAMATGFATPGLGYERAIEWPVFFLLTLWIIALPEEGLFRGVIQGLLEKVMRNTWWALAIASVVFGLSHLDNTNGAAPDWRYVLLATIAGAFYGLAYIRTGNLAAPILTHTLVDVTWRGLFSGAH